jgi:pimeloyl-ACP methyl ester carboxylesterase
MLEYAHKYKNRLKKLVFVGGSNEMPVHPDLIDLAKNGDSDAVKLMMKWGYEGSKRFIGGNPVEKIIQSPRDIRGILAVDLVACNNYKNGSEAAKLIEFPSMFIFGSLDKMVNLESGKKFASLINNSSTHIIEGCGHMIMIEKAFEMRDKVLEFLKK